MLQKTVIRSLGLICLLVGVSVSYAATDDWTKLYDQQFKIQQQLMEQQLRQQQQELRQQLQLMQQQLKFATAQFKVHQQPIGQQMLWQQNITPIISDSPTMISTQSSLSWRSLEAAGLTHFSDHAKMFKRSIDVMREGLTHYQLGPDTIISPSGQLMWEVKPIKTTSGEFLRGLSTGLHFGAALINDWDIMVKGGWNPLQSYSLEAIGVYGISEVSRRARVRVTSLGSDLKSPITTFAARWTYGLTEAVKGVSSQVGRQSFSPNINEITNYLDSIGMTAAGYAYGSVGANMFKAAAQFGRFITYPLFEYSVFKIRGLPSKSLTELYGMQFKQINMSLPNSPFRIQQTQFISDRIITFSESMNFGNVSSGIINERQIIAVSTNPLDRFLIKANILSPNSFFDPNTSTITRNRQWSVTTREITTPYMPSNWSLPQQNWSLPQQTWSLPQQNWNYNSGFQTNWNNFNTNNFSNYNWNNPTNWNNSTFQNNWNYKWNNLIK